MGRLIRRVLFRRLRALDDHLSRDCVTAAFQRPTRGRDEQPHSPLSDLAPGEVYRAGRVTPAAGGLLHHRFTLTWRLRARRSAFCCTVSRVTPGGCYPPPCSVEPGRSSAPLLVTRSSCRPIHISSLPAGRAGRSPHQRPDSSVRTMIAEHSGHCSTSSISALRTFCSSLPVRVMVHAPHVPARKRAAPVPPRLRSFS